MKSRILALMTVVTLFVALATLVGRAAQEAQQAENLSNALTSTANPVPLISQPLVPDVAKPGGPGFTLSVNGTGFVSGSWCTGTAAHGLPLSLAVQR